MLDNTVLSRLAEQYGTPLYVIDESVLDANRLEIDKAFSNFPVQICMAYPYKANSLHMIINYMFNYGRWAEVASEMEMDLALKIGIDPERIIFNAPYKSIRSLQKAIALRCKIHIDNMDELETLISLLNNNDKFDGAIEVGLRISTPDKSLWSRFGFGDKEWIYALEKIIGNPKLSLVGLHTHKSNIIDLEMYKQHISHIFKLADLIETDYKIRLMYVDIGSGFANNWPKPSDSDAWLVPLIEEYANIVRELYGYYKLSVPYLVIEPGRRSVSSAACLLTKITSVKYRDEQAFVIVDSALNFIPGAEIYRYRISRIQNQLEPEKNQEEIKQNNEVKYLLCGCLCDSLDILSPNFYINDPRINQIIKIDDVGGYDMARSFIWQLPLPSIIWVSGENHKIIRTADARYDAGS